MVVLLGAVPSLADRPMSTRFSTNDTGNITFAANALMVCPAAAAGCTAARTTPPIASGTNNAIDNNTYNMTYVNASPGTVPGEGASFNSSSATLTLPPTATVLSLACIGAPTQARARSSPGADHPPLWLRTLL